MLIKTFYRVLLFLLLIQGIVFAEIKIFLFPIVEIDGIDITLKDVGMIDYNSTIHKKIEDIEIFRELYMDGYLDRMELRNLLNRNIKEDIIIFGNAVRILTKDDDSDKQKKYEREWRDYIVTKGDRVNLIVKGNGITIGSSGMAVNDGKIGDEIKVKLKGSKVVRGRLTKGRLVEVTQ
ncbi:MAG: flagella basal body P-ring formation protein FlgA [Spirochaetota bacterium]|nr:flagella basal body P-ring formation protein FlgA [Spirochaetota bacterium]